MVTTHNRLTVVVVNLSSDTLSVSIMPVIQSQKVTVAMDKAEHRAGLPAVHISQPQG